MKRYYKDGKQVERPTLLEHNGKTYLNPNDTTLQSAGYEIREIPTPQYLPTYEQRVVARIREHYSVDDELALLRQRDTKPEEFAAYNDYCERVKAEEKTR